MDIMEGFSGFLHHWEGIEAQLEQATADKARACAMQGLKLTREESLRRKSTCPAFISLWCLPVDTNLEQRCIQHNLTILKHTSAINSFSRTFNQKHSSF